MYPEEHNNLKSITGFFPSYDMKLDGRHFHKYMFVKYMPLPTYWDLNPIITLANNTISLTERIKAMTNIIPCHPSIWLLVKGYIKQSIISLMGDTRIKYATLLRRSPYLSITISFLCQDSLVANLLDIWHNCNYDRVCVSESCEFPKLNGNRNHVVSYQFSFVWSKD